MRSFFPHPPNRASPALRASRLPPLACPSKVHRTFEPPGTGSLLLTCLVFAACPSTKTPDTGSPTPDSGDSTPEETASADTGLPPLEDPTDLADATPGWFGQLAYSPVADAWFVASQSGGIVGRMMGDDGSPRTDVFNVSPGGQDASWAPAVAYAPDADLFGVVWVDYTDDGWQAWARFVRSDGTTRGEALPMDLGQPVPNLGGERASDLAWDAPNGRFVYVWHGTFLTTLDLDGTLGPIVSLTDASPNEHWGASVAVNPDAGEYCMAYDRRNDASFALTPVDAATLRAGRETTTPITSTRVLVTYDTTHEQYLVTYDNGYVTGVKAFLLGSCDLGDVVASFDVMPGIATTSLACNPVSEQYAIIAQNAADDGNTWVIFDGSGTVLASGDPFLGSTTGNYAPEIAPDTAHGTFAAISSREYTQTRFVSQIGFDTVGR